MERQKERAFIFHINKHKKHVFVLKQEHDIRRNSRRN